jgi:L,D-transpeptidase ErfK/SrfK
MTLGSTSYGIHGTNVQWSIGRLATHGCIRLYNEDMRELYDRIPEGTPVRLVYQTVKLGARDSVVYLEVHPDVYGKRSISLDQLQVQLLVAGTLGDLDAGSLDADQIQRVFEQASGVPVPIASTASEPR